jgi:hypothetical protein
LNQLPTGVVFTLDFVVQEAEVDMLKLDIEGAEYAVLAGASSQCLSRIQRMTAEYHPNGSLADIMAPLENTGLKCVFGRDDGDGYGIACFEHFSHG